jgi:putative transposase
MRRALRALLAEQLCRKRKGQVSRKWYVEAFIKVKRKCCYLYRAVEQDGNLVDSLLSEKRDMAAAHCFFRSAAFHGWQTTRTSGERQD